MAWYTWAGGGEGGSGCAHSPRHAASIRATKRFQARATVPQLLQRRRGSASTSADSTLKPRLSHERIIAVSSRGREDHPCHAKQSSAADPVTETPTAAASLHQRANGIPCPRSMSRGMKDEAEVQGAAHRVRVLCACHGRCCFVCRARLAVDERRVSRAVPRGQS